MMGTIVSSDTSWIDAGPPYIKRIESKLDAILAMLQSIITKEAKMAITLDSITAEVANNTSVTNSVVALVQNLANQLKNIPPSTDPTTQAAIDALTATLKANDGTIAAAVTANTPAATPPSS